MFCRTCGKFYEESSEERGYYFSSESLPKGSYTGPKGIAAIGEVILTCPADPLELDESMKEGDLVQDYDVLGEVEPD